MKHLPASAVAALALLSLPAAAATDDFSSGGVLSLPFASKQAAGSAFWDVQAEFGLTESLFIGGELGGMHSLDTGAPTRFGLSPVIGLEFDVVEWVPYAASGPMCLFDVDPGPAVGFGAQLILGVDYRLTRSLSLGAQYHFSATVDDDAALLHRAGLRAMYHWGW
jgi:hypothetical protein